MASSSADIISETRVVGTVDAFAYVDAVMRMSGVTVETVVPRDACHAELLAIEHARTVARERYGMLGEPSTATALRDTPREIAAEILPQLVGPDADGVLLRLRTFRDAKAAHRFQQLTELATAAATQILPE
jgi:hypothetical protein